MLDILANIKEDWKKLFEKNGIDKDIYEVLDKIKNFNNVYPPKEEIFRVFELIDFKDVKVIILGQDPYHSDLVANGIAFSASNKVKTPRSLANIFKELNNDLGIDHFNNNDLSGWVKQGVLLLNTCLTVQKSLPGSHTNIGWEQIIIKIIKILSKNNNLIYCLWGNFAKNLYNILNINSEFVIKSAHPSPFSYKKGFENSKPFSIINNYLISLKLEKIDWTK
ncbi:uracil-DNA glycosylase [Spiroplasma gladiatoris]|uniref:Uracil-DNA glycosylase n=1 Tax=Spiroplasma gladiatoris TaxID=2143 RepID=A0A4V1AQ46_9MOLU|nr:uracil-DNA glycosylase [Spiroplasma gladiatoris]QBQ07229.1 uracil-DNA glycosylase [Spiroplasma gladiatoris]